MVVGMYRARSATEIIDAAFQLVKGNLPILLTISAIGIVPSAIGQLFMMSDITQGGRLNPLAMWQGNGLIFGIVGFLATLMIQGSLAVALADIYEGRIPNLGKALELGLKKLPWLAINFVATAIALTVAFMLLIFPAFFVFAWTFVSPVVIMLEDKTGIDALGRSKELGSDHKRRVFLYLLVVWVAALVVGIIAWGIGAVTGSIIVTVVMSSLANLVIMPLLMAFCVLHYYDARIRKEGYDVELMGRATPMTPQPVVA